MLTFVSCVGTMSTEGENFAKSAVATILAKLDSMSLRIENLEKVTSSIQTEKGTSSVQVEAGEGTSSSTFTPEQVVELLYRRQRVREDRDRIDQLLGNTQPYGQSPKKCSTSRTNPKCSTS